MINKEKFARWVELGASTVYEADEVLEKVEVCAAKEAEMVVQYKQGVRRYDLRGWHASVEDRR